VVPLLWTIPLVLVLAAVMSAQTSEPLPDLKRLEAMTARFAPVEIGADISALAQGERTALVRLVQAAQMMDGLFLRQSWAGNESMLLDILADESPLGRARLRYFLINKGPWSRLDHDAVFIPGAPAKPPAANFYPAGASKADVESWLATLPAEERRLAEGFFTTIRRAPAAGGRPFTLVPYSLEYQGELAQAAALLRQAAEATSQPTLRRFLESRAAAFTSNDYYDSDVAWMELDASIEPTIGPYEVYEDEWFNYKAAFEAFITLRDDVETAKLARFSGELQGLENALPIEARFRNPSLGALAPIRVVNVIFSAGDANRGVQTAAFNLPNDERIVREKGAKRVMLKNVQEAKFARVLKPIAGVALSPSDAAKVGFDPFFTHILMHELMHGLGPHEISLNGRATTVRQELKENHSAIEEAKADVSGLWALQQLVDTGVIDRGMEQTMYTTFLASAFRSIRFGLNEAHGRGIALQLNYFLDSGAVVVAKDGRFSVDHGRIKQSVIDLTREIMTIQAEGRYASATALLTKLAVLRPEVKAVLDRLDAVPVDIEPRFTTARRLLAEAAAGR
jgi:hypothetical protein